MPLEPESVNCGCYCSPALAGAIWSSGNLELPSTTGKSGTDAYGIS